MLEDSPHRFDLFFRDAGDRLQHAFLSDSGWVVETMGGWAITDPAALSTGQGRWDVVAVGTDHRLYHYSWQPGWTSIGFARMSEIALAYGTPALVSSGGGRLHAFFRGGDRRVYQLRWNGTLLWILDPVGHEPVMDLPSAAVTYEAATPTLRVYTRAPDSRLTEMSQRDGVLWTGVGLACK